MLINFQVLNQIKKLNQNKRGNFMYDYKLPNDLTNQVMLITNEQKKKKTANDLLNSINEINNKFNPSTNVETLNNVQLERLNFNKKSNEEIESQAKNMLADFKNAGIKKIEDNNVSKQNELLNNKKDVEQKTIENKNQVSNYYEEAKNDASDEALKRGLSRSSIVINQLNAYDNNAIEEYKKLDKDLTNKTDAINFELNALNGQLQDALNDFNISYAVKLQEKINGLNEELKKEEEEILKYNNEIAIKEAQFNNDLTKLQKELEDSDWDKNIDLVDIYGKYGSNVVSKIKQENILSATKQYLNGLSKQEALEIINDKDIKLALGSLYDILLKEYTK
jgi:hypothetical protein